MTKYRPVEGRSIEDVKAGDLVQTSIGVVNVLHTHGPQMWVAPLHGEYWQAHLRCICKPDYIVEPIPEPKIEVSYVPTVFTRAHVYETIDQAVAQLISWGYPAGEGEIQKITLTDGKITAVELVKDQS